VRFGSLLVAMLLLGATGALGLITVERMQAGRELVLHTYRVRGLLKDLRADIGETHASRPKHPICRNSPVINCKRFWRSAICCRTTRSNRRELNSSANCSSKISISYTIVSHTQIVWEPAIPEKRIR